MNKSDVFFPNLKMSESIDKDFFAVKAEYDILSRKFVEKNEKIRVLESQLQESRLEVDTVILKSLIQKKSQEKIFESRLQKIQLENKIEQEKLRQMIEELLKSSNEKI